jgi:hypothetical protein
MHNKTLFKINWHWVNRVFPVVFVWEFSTATWVMFGETQTLSLHFITANKTAFASTFRQALCMTFWLGLTCYPHGLVQWGFLEETLPECLEEIPLAFGRNRWFQHDGTAAHLACRSGNILPPLTMIAGLDRVGLWLTLPGCWTSHHWTSSYGAI